MAAGGGASDPGRDAGGGGAEKLSGVSAGGTETAGKTGRQGPGGHHDDPRTGTQLDLKWSHLACSNITITSRLTVSEPFTVTDSDEDQKISPTAASDLIRGGLWKTLNRLINWFWFFFFFFLCLLT